MSQMDAVLLQFRLSLLSGIMLSISIIRFFRSKKQLSSSHAPIVLDRSVSEKVAKAYREELRVLEVKVEALKSMVERLRDYHERGLINDDEFNALSKKHAEEIDQLSRHLVGKRLVVELFELEEIREKIVDVFLKKISDLNETILMIRRKLKFDQVLNQQKIEAPFIKPNETSASSSISVPSTATFEAITSDHPQEPVPIPKELPKETIKDETQVTQQPKKFDTKEKKEDIEDELSRIRADVESLLQELEQMEKNRD